MIPALPLFAGPFVFLRHGESTANLDDTVAGWRDVVLTPRGRAQALAAAARCRGKGITALYVSALSRARETAAPIAAALGLEPVVLPGLAERSWGVLEGQPRSLRQPGITPPGGETPEVFAARVLAALARIPAGGLPLVVAHSGVFRVLCASLGAAGETRRVDNALPRHFHPATGGWLHDPL